LYPAIVTLMGTAVTVFLMTFVVPKLLSALSASGRELPAITRAVKAVSDFLLGYGWLVAAAVLAAGIGLRLIVRTRGGRRAWHRLLLRIPLVGELVVKETIARLGVVLAALLRSGVVFVEALEVAEDTTGNVVFRDALGRCREAVAAGKDLAAPLERAGVFPPMVVRMLAVGQQAGELEAMLEKLASSYERQVAVATARLAVVLEPLLIVVLALMVGLIALATILPILEASHVL
ncbi:MAG: type II secretion system F family protein, partial [Planctomycetota bacterium]